MMRKIEDKNYRSVRSYKTRSRKFQNNLKKLKNTITDSFQANIGWRRMRKRENKNYSSVLFLSDA